MNGDYMKIYIITHKNNIQVNVCDSYVPLMVGNRENGKYLRDNSGDNISEKNDSYCELTGLYWIWKNDITSNIIGLVHYHRFFAKVGLHVTFKERYFLFSHKERYHILNERDISKLLCKYDVIVKKSGFRMITTGDTFRKCIGENLYNDIGKVIFDLYPTYYDRYQKEQKKHSHFNCNMFIGKKQIMDKYCEWLFAILARLDEMHVNKTGKRYHNREIGYVGEMLFGVWLKSNGINYYISDVVNTDSGNEVGCVMGVDELGSFLRYMFNKYIIRK